MRQDIEELPRFESKNYTRTKGGKTLRCDWGRSHFPQERWVKYKATLKGCVGMKWDDVYSKLKHEFKDILVDKNYCIRVELNCFKRNGKVYSAEGKEFSQWRSESYYVLEEDGILRITKCIKFNREKPAKKIIKYNKLSFYKDKEGIWWQVETKPCTKENSTWAALYTWGYAFPDVFSQYSKTSNYLYQKYGESVFCTSKRQCGKRLCKKLNALEKAQ